MVGVKLSFGIRVGMVYHFFAYLFYPYMYYLSLNHNLLVSSLASFPISLCTSWNVVNIDRSCYFHDYEALFAK